jgi:hypothetical protein
LDALSTRNLQFISGLKFGHCQSISQCGNVLHRCVCSLCRFSSGYSPTLPCWKYCTQCYFSSRSNFECKSFRLSVHGAFLCSGPVLCPLVGLDLSLSLGPHIPPVCHGASLCSGPVLCPLVGLDLSLSLGTRLRSCIVKATVLRQLPAWPPTLLLLSPIFLRPNQTTPCPPATRTFEPRSPPSVRSSTNEKATPTLLFARTQIFRRYSRGRFGPRHAHHRHGCSSSACFLWCGLQENCNDANDAFFSPVWRCTTTTSHSWSRR